MLITNFSSKGLLYVQGLRFLWNRSDGCQNQMHYKQNWHFFDNHGTWPKDSKITQFNQDVLLNVPLSCMYLCSFFIHESSNQYMPRKDVNCPLQITYLKLREGMPPPCISCDRFQTLGNFCKYLIHFSPFKFGLCPRIMLSSR